MKHWWKEINNEVAQNAAIYEEIKEKFTVLRGDLSQPVVASVVLIAYNEEKRILPALFSLSKQQVDFPIEVIVVNNNSTDGTQKIIDKCGAISVFQTLQGPGHARQAGLDFAHGTYVICADADTLYPPRYVTTMVSALLPKEVVAAYAPCGFIDDGKKSAFSLSVYEIFRDMAQKARFMKQPELCVGGATLALRRDVACKYGFRTDIKRGEDGALVNEMKNDGKIELVLNQKARVKTSSRTLDSDGSMLSMIVIRLKRELKRLPEYFKPQRGVRKDTDDNLI